MKARVMVFCVATLLLVVGCTAPRTIPADNPGSSRFVQPDYAQANVRSGYYVDVGGGITAPARVFVYQSASP